MQGPAGGGREHPQAREGPVVASNDRRLRDEDSSRIFIVPPRKLSRILHAAGALSHTTLADANHIKV